ncbi:MAG TPA: phasin family protein [Burkholderiales bacterium]
MTATPEQFSALGKAQLDAALRFATVAAESAEKLVDLQLKTARTVFSDGAKNVKSLSEIKDVAELPAWTGANLQPVIDKATAYARSLYDLAAEARSEISALLEGQVAEFNKQVTVAMDAAVKSAPAGSEAVIPALKSVIGTANSVYESIAKAGKQLAAMTEANLAAAAQTASPVKKKST